MFINTMRVQQKFRLPFRIVTLFVIFSFLTSLFFTPTQAQAQTQPSILNLPQPGVMVPMSSSYIPAFIKGMTLSPDNPFQFDFIVDSGHSGLQGEDFKKESKKLIKYFLAALAIPETDQWVNLSPYEANRIIPAEFGKTEMGRDLLAQDYLLKQITASLMYPEGEVGKQFWNRIYDKAYAQHGNIDIPVNTFNKVWIIPDKAVVYEGQNTVIVTESSLKVMLEEDYFALSKNTDTMSADASPKKDPATSDIIRAIILPELEKEINHGKNFAPLRQIYQSMILATWYKNKFQKSPLNQVYSGQNKTDGIEINDVRINQKIYDRYLTAFKKGVYDFIKEDFDPLTQELIPRKYFSGGMAVSNPKVGSADALGFADTQPVGDQQRFRTEFQPSEANPIQVEQDILDMPEIDYAQSIYAERDRDEMVQSRIDHGVTLERINELIDTARRFGIQPTPLQSFKFLDQDVKDVIGADFDPVTWFKRADFGPRDGSEVDSFKFYAMLAFLNYGEQLVEDYREGRRTKPMKLVHKVISTGNHALSAMWAAAKFKDYIKEQGFEDMITVDVELIMGQDAETHKKQRLSRVAREYGFGGEDGWGVIRDHYPDDYWDATKRGLPIPDYKSGEDLLFEEMNDEFNFVDSNGVNYYQTRHAGPDVVAGYAVMAMEVIDQLEEMGVDLERLAKGDFAVIDSLGSGGKFAGLLQLVAEYANVMAVGVSSEPSDITYRSIIAGIMIRIGLDREGLVDHADGNAATPEQDAIDRNRELALGNVRLSQEDLLYATALLTYHLNLENYNRYGQGYFDFIEFLEDPDNFNSAFVEATSGMGLAARMLDAELFDQTKQMLSVVTSRNISTNTKQAIITILRYEGVEGIKEYFKQRRIEIAEAKKAEREKITELAQSLDMDEAELAPIINYTKAEYVYIGTINPIGAVKIFDTLIKKLGNGEADGERKAFIQILASNIFPAHELARTSFVQKLIVNEEIEPEAISILIPILEKFLESLKPESTYYIQVDTRLDLFDAYVMPESDERVQQLSLALMSEEALKRLPQRLEDKKFKKTIQDNVPKKASVLTLGQGGRFADVDELILQGHDVTVSDIAPAAVRALQQRKEELGFDNVDVQQIDIYQDFAGVEGGSMDVVINNLVFRFETTDKVVEALKRIKKVLKKNKSSRLIFQIQSIDDYLYERDQKGGTEVEPHVFERDAGNGMKSIRNYWTEAKLRKALKAAGFKIDSIELHKKQIYTSYDEFTLYTVVASHEEFDAEDDLPTRDFGQSDLRFFPLGTGFMWFAEQWPEGNKSWVEPSDQEIEDFLMSAYEQLPGFGEDVQIMFDTSSAYSHGIQELKLGEFFKRNGHIDLLYRTYIATKWGLNSDYTTMDLSLENLYDSVAQSVERLGKIDLSYIHFSSRLKGIQELDPLRNGDIISEMQRMRDSNYAGLQHLGISISDEEMLEVAINDGIVDGFDVVQTRARIFYERPDLMEKLRRKGKAIVLNSPTRDAFDQDMSEREVLETILKTGGYSVLLTGTRNHLIENISMAKTIQPENIPQPFKYRQRHSTNASLTAFFEQLMRGRPLEDLGYAETTKNNALGHLRKLGLLTADNELTQDARDAAAGIFRGMDELNLPHMTRFTAHRRDHALAPLVRDIIQAEKQLRTAIDGFVGSGNFTEQPRVIISDQDKTVLEGLLSIEMIDRITQFLRLGGYFVLVTGTRYEVNDDSDDKGTGEVFLNLLPEDVRHRVLVYTGNGGERRTFVASGEQMGDVDELVRHEFSPDQVAEVMRILEEVKTQLGLDQAIIDDDVVDEEQPTRLRFLTQGQKAEGVEDKTLKAQALFEEKFKSSDLTRGIFIRALPARGVLQMTLANKQSSVEDALGYIGRLTGREIKDRHIIIQDDRFQEAEASGSDMAKARPNATLLNYGKSVDGTINLQLGYVEEAIRVMDLILHKKSNYVQLVSARRAEWKVDEGIPLAIEIINDLSEGKIHPILAAKIARLKEQLPSADVVYDPDHYVGELHTLREAREYVFADDPSRSYFDFLLELERRGVLADIELIREKVQYKKLDDITKNLERAFINLLLSETMADLTRYAFAQITQDILNMIYPDLDEDIKAKGIEGTDARYEELREQVMAEPNADAQLVKAIKYQIASNILELNYNAGFKVSFDEIDEQIVDVNNSFERMLEELNSHDSGVVMVYLDNPGELPLNMIRAELLLKRGFDVYFVAKDKAARDDLTVENVLDYLNKWVGEQDSNRYLWLRDYFGSRRNTKNELRVISTNSNIGGVNIAAFDQRHVALRKQAVMVFYDGGGNQYGAMSSASKQNVAFGFTVKEPIQAAVTLSYGGVTREKAEQARVFVYQPAGDAGPDLKQMGEEQDAARRYFVHIENGASLNGQNRVEQEFGDKLTLNPETQRLKPSEEVSPENPLVKVNYTLRGVRHAKTNITKIKDDEEIIVQGMQNVKGINDLSEEGWVQARQVAKELFDELEKKIRSGEEIIVVVNELMRSQQTAQAFIEHTITQLGGSHTEAKDGEDTIFSIGEKGRIRVVVDARANELNYGIWENKRWKDIPPDQQELIYRMFEGDVFLTPENGESYFNKLLATKEMLIDWNRRFEGREILLFGSGGQLTTVDLLVGHSNLAHDQDVELRGGELEWQDGEIDWERNVIDHGEYVLFHDAQNAPGGIDFNPSNFEIQTRGGGFEFNFENDAPQWQGMQIEGLVPVIINVLPVTNLNLLLGATPQVEPQQLTSLKPLANNRLKFLP